KRYQQEQPYGMVNHHYVKEAWIEQALQWPDMIVSSDALPAMSLSQKTNPNIAGTYSRLLGHYARDRNTLSLMEAIGRATINPARWLEKSSDTFKRKGRLQIGADADLVLFDPEKIMPGAAYGDPYQPAVGIGWVVVGGEVVVANGQRVEGHYPGKRILNRTDKN
ncbi:MAG: amidohydrolase family protein, partial [Halieaceae bacterium]